MTYRPQGAVTGGCPRETQRLGPIPRIKQQSRIPKCRAGHGTPALRGTHNTLASSIAQVLIHLSVFVAHPPAPPHAQPLWPSMLPVAVRSAWLFRFPRLPRPRCETDDCPEASSSVAIASPSAAYPSVACADPAAISRTPATTYNFTPTFGPCTHTHGLDGHRPYYTDMR